MGVRKADKTQHNQPFYRSVQDGFTVQDHLVDLISRGGVFIGDRFIILSQAVEIKKTYPAQAHLYHSININCIIVRIAGLLDLNVIKSIITELIHDICSKQTNYGWDYSRRKRAFI
jgi:hypothetical protein